MRDRKCPFVTASEFMRFEARIEWIFSENNLLFAIGVLNFSEQFFKRTQKSRRVEKRHRRRALRNASSTDRARIVFFAR